MASSKKAPEPEIELHPDAWARFERAAGVVAKTPPQHRVAKKKRSAESKLKKRPRTGAARSALQSNFTPIRPIT